MFNLDVEFDNFILSCLVFKGGYAVWPIGTLVSPTIHKLTGRFAKVGIWNGVSGDPILLTVEKLYDTFFLLCLYGNNCFRILS